MLEIMRDLRGFGELLSLLKENGVALIETSGLKLVFHEEEDEELTPAIGFAAPDKDDEDEEEFVEAKTPIGFSPTLYDKLNVKEMK